MDNELDLGRYSSALRRRARVIVVLAVVGALVGLLVALRSQYVTTATIAWIDRAAELDSAGVDPDNVDVRQALTQVASTLDGDGFESTLSDDASVSAVAVLTETGGSVSVVVGADSPGAVTRAMAQVAEVASQTYVHEVRAQVDGIVGNFQRQADTLGGQLDSIEQQIAAAGDDQTTLTEGLLVQAETLRADRAEAVDQGTALEQYAAALEQDLRLQTVTGPKRPRPPIAMAIAGGLLGAALAAGGVLLMAALDHRIRSRRDLERIGLTGLLGVLSSKPDDAELDVLAGAVAQTARRAGRAVVQFVPVSDQRPVHLADVLGPRAADVVMHDRRPLQTDASETVAAAAEALGVITVVWGRDTRVSTMSAANRLAAVAGSPIGVVLVGIPRREIDRIER
jgi:hypothetical protein